LPKASAASSDSDSDNEPEPGSKGEFFRDNDDNEGTLEQLLEDHLGQEDFYSIKDSKFTKNTLTKLKEFIKEHYADLVLTTVADLDDLPYACVHCPMPVSEPEQYLLISTETSKASFRISAAEAIAALD
jgi:hypothetical protein